MAALSPAPAVPRRGAAAAVAAVGGVVAAIALALPPVAGAVAVGVYALAGARRARRVRRRRILHGRFGLANSVTLVRAGGAAVFAGLVAAPELVAGTAAWLAAGAAALLLALDGVDGWAARRQGLASAFGARFDMETDALTILALSALALALGKAGPWVLALGLMRYAFVAAGLLWPRLAAPLPPSFRRKAVCVLQIGVLAALVAPVVVPPASTGLAPRRSRRWRGPSPSTCAWLARPRP